jgi:hypothetical protein
LEVEAEAEAEAEAETEALSNSSASASLVLGASQGSSNALGAPSPNALGVPHGSTRGRISFGRICDNHVGKFFN